jgi:hypothetical protein
MPNVLWLAMTRFAEHDNWRASGLSALDYEEQRIRPNVNARQQNPMRDSARCVVLEGQGHDVYTVSVVSADVAGASARWLNTNFTGRHSRSRGFIPNLAAKWPGVSYKHVMIDWLWLPDSYAWIVGEGYLANDAAVFKNLADMARDGVLTPDFEILVPINFAFARALGPHTAFLRQHFSIAPLTVENLYTEHLGVASDVALGFNIMASAYGKDETDQIESLMGVPCSKRHALEAINDLLDVPVANPGAVKFLRLTAAATGAGAVAAAGDSDDSEESGEESGDDDDEEWR